MNDPFTVLGLPARRDLGDEDVRAAWRRIAAATHPDRADGGDPQRYSVAAAAYDTLRTSFGRGEALAELGRAAPWGSSRVPRHGLRRGGARLRPSRAGVPLTGRRPSRARAPLVARRVVLGAGVVTAAALGVAVVGWTPASIALAVGAVTWLLTGLGRWRRGGWDR